MNPIAIIVHGGAGPLAEERVSACRAGCAIAARAGYEVLRKGGGALDAVEEAVSILEANPEFNAGYGATLNRDGEAELDASIMDGSLRAGAVGALKHVRQPVRVARMVLEDGVHVLLVGEGAARFAASHGAPMEPMDDLITARARVRWERERDGLVGPSGTGDTVGAVAIDRTGRVASSSSTGGLSFKYPGRIGDSPQIGSGLYALDEAGAATATGHGESILKVVMSKAAVDALAAGATATEAAERAVLEMARRTRGEAGIIIVDAAGRVAHHRNTSHMPWASVTEAGEEDGV